MDVGLTIHGDWGTFINGKSYQQMPLDTYKGWQYTTYYDQKRRLSIARRKLPAGAWEVVHFEDYIFEGNDNHNVTVLDICRKDGTIHLSFDQHNESLHYRVSEPGVASNPDKVKWDASLFGEVRDWLKKGERLESVTYPRFVPTPEGNLLFVSRHGRPRNGYVTLCTYDPTQGGWSDRWPVTKHEGTYVFEGAVAISTSVRRQLLDAGVPGAMIRVIPSAVDPGSLFPRWRGVRHEPPSASTATPPACSRSPPSCPARASTSCSMPPRA